MNRWAIVFRPCRGFGEMPVRGPGAKRPWLLAFAPRGLVGARRGQAVLEMSSLRP
jgi:hypothetical protein